MTEAESVAAAFDKVGADDSCGANDVATPMSVNPSNVPLGFADDEENEVAAASVETLRLFVVGCALVFGFGLGLGFGASAIFISSSMKCHANGMTPSSRPPAAIAWNSEGDLVYRPSGEEIQTIYSLVSLSSFHQVPSER